MTPPPPTRLLAGEVGKPHGISGEVYVVPISDDPTRFETGSVLQRDSGELVVASSRRHGTRFLVKFEGIDSRDDAETLRGPLFVPAEKARPLDDDEFWPHDLVGATLVGLDGRSYGSVRSVVPGSAQDLLVIDTPRGERMVPFVKDIVRSVEIAAGRVVVDPPQGLLD